MIKFVEKAFSKVFEVFLWLNLVVGVIIGWNIIGSFFYNTLDWDSKGASKFVGMLLGIIIFLIINIIGGGLISTFLSINEKLEILVGNSCKSGTPNTNSSGLNLNNISPINQTVINASDSWVCKKCNERNPNTSSTCKGCGSYK
jgi:hypothetical protein